MRKLLLPVVLILAGLFAYAGAQNINRSLQLSQSGAGPFAVDANNGVYFPGHILTVGKPVPTITGTGSPTISGTDTAGLITMGSSATTAVVLFGRAYLTAPFCVISPQNAFTTTNIAYTTVTTSISLTQNSTSGNLINYFCVATS